eukprot:Plantae.Rhodophyta-Hildenbrandia_rubra.ctg21805.p1 GENE.Plantae.Rhodophyta-Hildenbrandia_rubra.ctg21805~~Plantae.Rhodophyta-Hildenbrandia_rubra.ctg21805.p1  ORF type:complete len:446 (-),score=41.85 Plantae.Rhodophyta-Hildenbrandia_rubra.ctg21805:751-2088(-)
MYGDYEAQRHWMEITVNLPASEWYHNTTNNDLQYWGLDYPPLSAYASFIVGKAIEWFEPDAVKLFDSRGYQSRTSRSLMRLSVILADVLIFIPGIFLCVRMLYGDNWKAVSVFCFVLSTPAFILIDHGHFQYNNVSLGFFFMSIYSFSNDYDATGAIFFTSAVYFKQMTLYYAPAVAAYLLGKLVRSPSLKTSIEYCFKILGAITLTTILSFLPWITNPSSITQILLRIFPISRGLFEDKVSNIWCTLTLLTKAHRHLTPSSQAKLCTTSTLLSVTPFCIAVFRNPSRKTLVVSTAGSALAFYLFSYQVHEKQILIPLAPLVLVVQDWPGVVLWISGVAMLSLFPLLHREGLMLAFVACCGIHVIVFDWLYGWDVVKEFELWKWKVMKIGGVLAGVVASVVMILVIAVEAPRNMPDLFVYAVTGYCCAHLCLAYFRLVTMAFEGR